MHPDQGSGILETCRLNGILLQAGRVFQLYILTETQIAMGVSHLYIAGLYLAKTLCLAMVAAVGSSLAQPIFGFLSDRWGTPRMIVFSIAWLGLLMGLVGFAWNYWSVVLVVGLGALGSAAFHPAGATLASTGGGKRRGAAMSIFSVSGNLGTALSPLLVLSGAELRHQRRQKFLAIGANGTV